MKQFKGLPISSGKVVAKICVYSQVTHQGIVERTLDSDKEVEAEIKRFESAVTTCSEGMDSIAANVRKEIGESEAEIYVAQKHIMNDPVIIDEIKKRITANRKNAELIIDEVYSEYEEKFANLDNQYMSERSNDISDIRTRLLNYLLKTQPGFNCEGQGNCQRGKERIIVAEELTTEMMVHMNLSRVYGIVTEHGGLNSHAAIIARAAGIPAVTGADGIFKEVRCGSEILVDGDNGIVIVKPDQETQERILASEKVDVSQGYALSTPQGMEVLANASMLEDVQQAVNMNADGIGLFRTELCFIREQHLLNEQEQYSFYQKIIKIMGEKPVTFRMLDVGGDKQLAFLKSSKRTNPHLQMRGSRFLLANREIFVTQLRSLLRLSKRYKMRVLIPMIIDSLQVDKLISVVKEVMATVEAKSENLRLGVMFEVPSAFFEAEEIIKKVDFASIGSNDLIQYLFAVERENEIEAQDFNPEHPVLWKTMKMLSDVANKLDKPLSICGEMAGKKEMVSRFLDIGLTSLSVSPRLIPRVKLEMENYIKMGMFK